MNTENPIIRTMQYRGQAANDAAQTPMSPDSVNGDFKMPGFDAGQPSANKLAAGNRSVDKAKNEGERVYSEPDKASIVTNTRGRAQGVQDLYTADTKRNMYEHYDHNLAMNNPRGNLNGLSGARTRNLSRMADAYNNATRWDPGLAGRRTNSSFGTSNMQNSSYYKDKIDTQEMKQMRANERIDEQVRGYDAKRQDRVDSHNIAMQEWADQSAINLAGAIGQGDVAFGNALKQLVADVEYTQPNSNAMTAVMQRFISTLPYELKSKVAAQAERAWLDNPAWAQAYAYIMSGTQIPGYEDSIKQELFSSMMDEQIANGVPKGEAFIGAMVQFLKLGLNVSSAQMNAGLESILNSGLWF